MSVVTLPMSANAALGTELLDSLPGTIAWEADASSLDVVYVSRGTEAVLGYPASAWYAERATFWIRHIHPDDRERCIAFRRTEVAAGRDHELSYRMIHADGRVVWVRDRARCVCDAQGKVTRLHGLLLDISGAKGREEHETSAELSRKLTDLERFYAGILDSAEVGIYGLDVDGNTTFANAAGARALGYSPEEMIGKSQHDLIHDRHADGRPYPRHECPIYSSLKDGLVHTVSTEVFFRKDGVALPVEYVSTPIRDGERIVGAVVTFRDISEQLLAAERERRALMAEASRREAELARGQMARLFEQAPAVIGFYRGPTHVIEIANPLFKKITGDRALIGKPLAEAFPDLDPQLLAVLDQVYRTGKPFIGNEIPVRLAQRAAGMDEVTYWNFVWQPIIDPNGAVEGVFAHAVEVTEQIRARSTVERKAEELLQTTRALERSNRDLDQFAYVASHDLKAPLRGIANLAQWLEEDVGGQVGGEAVEQLRLMRGRVQRMDALIDGILTYSRAGRVLHRSESVDVGKLVRDIADLLIPANPNARIDVALDLPVVVAERVMLQQVFMNLMSNALKHAARADAVVRIDATREPDGWRFSVADNGPGIAPEFHERIWGIFQTLQARDRVEGAGIGLSIVKKIVESRGGRVSLDSTLGSGATFYFVWPSATEETE